MSKCSNCVISIDQCNKKLEARDQLRGICEQLYRFVEWVLNSKHSKKAKLFDVELVELPPKTEPADNVPTEAGLCEDCSRRKHFCDLLNGELSALCDLEIEYFGMLEPWLTYRRWLWLRKEVPEDIRQFMESYWESAEWGSL